LGNADWFFDLLANNLGNIEEKLRKYESSLSLPPALLDSIEYWWINSLPKEYGISDLVLAAVDGGGRFVDLAGGGALYLVRSVAVYNTGSIPSRKLLVDIANYRSKKYIDSLRTLIELMVAIDAVERMPSNSLLLIDGSYYVHVLKYLSRMIKVLRRIERGSSGERQLLKRIIEVIIYTLRLIEKAREKRTTICYVSKDSSLNIFKELLILEYFKKNNRKIYEVLSKIDHKLYATVIPKLRDNLREEDQKLIKLLVEEEYHDIHLVITGAENSVGYTKPMKPALRKKLRQAIVDVLNKNVLHKIRDVYRDYTEDTIEYIHDGIQELPIPLLSYVKLSPHDNPLMIEVVSPTDRTEKLIQHSEHVFTEPSEEFLNSLAIISKGYVNHKYYNIWLVQAHEYAHLSRKTFQYYLNYLDSMLRTRNLRIPFTRKYSLGGIH